MAPLVFRAPEGPAAREARRPHFVRRRASKPARALRSLRRPPHRRHCVAHVWLNASSRSPARPRRPRGGLQSVGVSVCCPAMPCRRSPSPRPGPAGLAAASNRSGCPCVARPCPAAAHRHRGLAPCLETRPCPPDPPAPFTPVGYSWLMLLGASPRTPARSRSPSGRRDQTPSIPPASHPVVTSHIPEPTPNFACNSPTTLSNPEIGSLELQRFQTSLKLHSLELHASFLGSGRIDACWWRSRRA